MAFKPPRFRSAALCLATVLCGLPAIAQTAAAPAGPATFTPPNPAVGTGRIEEVNGSERINYAGKLRMLSQRIPASACNRASGIGGWESIGYLQASVGEFNRIVTALEFGDVYISIKDAEQDRRVLARLAQMNSVWTPVRDQMRSMIRDGSDAEQVAYATEAAPELSDIIQRLVGDLIGEYADPTALLAADAVTLDIVGRQRMMPQTISKAACMISEGIDVEAAQAELRDSIAIYDLALGALQNGMAEVGILPAPDEKIAAGLAAIEARWREVEPLLRRLEDGGTLSKEERELVYSAMNELTAQMNTVSAGYATASKIEL